MQLHQVDLGLFEVNLAGLAYRDIHNVRLEIPFGGRGGGVLHLDGFQPDHAQAGQHERSQQEEHDVNQRNDFDPRLFVRQWRTDSHNFTSSLPTIWRKKHSGDPNPGPRPTRG